MGRTRDHVSFLSDYGTADEFAGVCRAVIADLAPHATVNDISHHVPRHDVRAGGLLLMRAIQYLPEGVVLAVVDPGVGTDRRAVAIEVADGAGVLVGPDNGLLAPAAQMAGGAGRVHQIVDPRFGLPAPGATFDGRDVFAPAAAHLCLGVDISELGPALDPATLVPGLVPVAAVEPDGVDAEVLWVDGFGNVQLNVGPEDVAHLGEPLMVTIGDEVRVAASHRAYDEIPTGAVGLVTDSYGMVSVAVARGSAAALLGIGEGDAVRVTSADDDGGPATGSTPVELGPTR